MESSDSQRQVLERNGGEPQKRNGQQQLGSGGQQQTTAFQQHFFPTTVQHAAAAGFSCPSGVVQPPMGSQEAMQAFANLGLFCTPAAGAHQQFPVPAPSMPPHLAAAAAAAAGYGQRLMSASQQANGCPAALARRNLAPGQPASSSAPPSHSSSSSINRSQRCGVCRGCQCKPCGQCTYCQDSPQFGGPGVKKQSCIERRCLRVLENRLQRDAPTFKARIGCNACEDCRSADCQICLVCLDRRFFNSKYMAGAMCAKKRCNNATALELPISAEQRSALKRPSECGGQQLAKRQVLIPPAALHQGGTAQQLNSNIARILSAASDGAAPKFGPAGPAFGRSSAGNSTSTNSPISENGAAIQQSATPPSLMAVPQLGRPFWAGPPSQMLGVLPSQYHFDQMASLAAAAAVGFPQQQGPHYPGHYQHKFLNYPKYEYFSAEEGANAGGVMANGSSGTNETGAVREDQMLMGAAQNGNAGGGGGTAENLLLPPSYSDVQKVVLQPL